MLDVTFGPTCNTCCVLPNFHQVGQWSLVHRAVSSRLPPLYAMPPWCSHLIYRYIYIDMNFWRWEICDGL